MPTKQYSLSQYVFPLELDGVGLEIDVRNAVRELPNKTDEPMVICERNGRTTRGYVTERSWKDSMDFDIVSDRSDPRKVVRNISYVDVKKIVYWKTENPSLS
jgi:hypothetical protein